MDAAAALLKKHRSAEDDYRIWQSGAWRGLAFRHGHSPEMLLKQAAEPNLAVIKDRPKALIVRGNGLFVKTIRFAGAWRRFRHAFLTPRPLRTLAGALHLRQLGIATPVVLLAAREYWVSGVPKRDVLITAELPEDTQFLNAERFKSQAEISALLNDLAHLLAVLHHGGFEHGDLNLRNLYRTADDGKFGLIDLDGCRLFASPLALSLRIRESARVVSSLAKQLRGDSRWTETELSPLLAEFRRAYAAASEIELPETPLRRRALYLVNRSHGGN